MPSPSTPTSALAHAVYAAGFLYDPDQDIIYSRMDALQRNFGYASRRHTTSSTTAQPTPAGSSSPRPCTATAQRCSGAPVELWVKFIAAGR